MVVEAVYPGRGRSSGKGCGSKENEGITSSHEFLNKTVILDWIGAHDQVDLGGVVKFLFVVHGAGSLMKRGVEKKKTKSNCTLDFHPKNKSQMLTRAVAQWADSSYLDNHSSSSVRQLCKRRREPNLTPFGSPKQDAAKPQDLKMTLSWPIRIGPKGRGGVSVAFTRVFTGY